MYVCHYGPPGNLIGAGVDWKQQVLPPTAALPAAAAMPKPSAADCLADVHSQLHKSLGTAGKKHVLLLLRPLLLLSLAAVPYRLGLFLALCLSIIVTCGRHSMSRHTLPTYLA